MIDEEMAGGSDNADAFVAKHCPEPLMEVVKEEMAKAKEARDAAKVGGGCCK